MSQTLLTNKNQGKLIKYTPLATPLFFQGLSDAYMSSFYFLFTIVVTRLMCVLTSFCHNNTDDVGIIYIFTVFYSLAKYCIKPTSSEIVPLHRKNYPKILNSCSPLTKTRRILDIPKNNQSRETVPAS